MSQEKPKRRIMSQLELEELTDPKIVMSEEERKKYTGLLFKCKRVLRGFGWHYLEGPNGIGKDGTLAILRLMYTKGLPDPHSILHTIPSFLYTLEYVIQLFKMYEEKME
ncbi:MAG: hypothetical protein PHW01_01140 [Patescibacteria group bacterium]|nr:hypothetical protein [Patescibacteria group bacterium]